VIPAGVSPGEEFQTRVAGKTITVTCPDNGEPGQKMMVKFDAPPTVSGQPKSRIKLSIGQCRTCSRLARCAASCDVDMLALRCSLRPVTATLAFAAAPCSICARVFRVGNLDAPVHPSAELIKISDTLVAAR